MNRQLVLLSILALLLVGAVWWLLLYSPGREQLAQVQEEITAAEAEQRSLEQQIARLEVVRSRAPETEAAIATLRGFVPADPALSGALRQIQAAADDAGVEMQSISTSRPALTDEATGLHTISLSLAANGSYFQVTDFLRRLEDPTITSRGVRFNALSLSPGEYPTLTATVSGQMFAVLEPVPGPEEELPEPEPTESPNPDEAGTAAEGTEGES